MRDRLKKIRSAMCYTQQEFADRLGVKKNTISQWESGVNQISPMMVAAICREFGVRKEYLEAGVEPMFTEQGADPLAMLARRYGLGEEDVGVIRSYVGLTPKKREAIRQFMKSAVSDDGAYKKTSNSAENEA